MEALVNQVIGRYKILEQISKGGTATVYRAHDEVLARDVAFKILHTHLEDSENIIERFKQEAQMIAQLDHPNIVNVFDFFEHEGRAVVIMELIEGSTLSTLVRLPFAVPEDFVLMIAMELLKGLKEAHKRDIIHRDIKPANILVSPHKGIKLSDFGLAKLKESEAGLTKTGMFVGTPSFSSPEQIQGLPLDQRSDIFSLGLTLFVLAKKAHAFKEKGDSQDTIARKIVEGEFNPKAQGLNLPLTSRSEAILNKAIQIDPLARFQSCEEMMKEIESVIKDRALWPYEEQLFDFLEDPEKICLELAAQSRTEQMSPKDFSEVLPKKKKWIALTSLAGLGIAAASAFYLLVLNSYPTWPLPIRASGETRMFSASSGARAELVGLEPKAASEWLIAFRNTDSVFDEQVLRHTYDRKTSSRPSYITGWGGWKFNTLVSKKRDRTNEGFLMYLPWMGSFNRIVVDYDPQAAEKIDSDGLIYRYLGRRQPGSLGLFRRNPLIKEAGVELGFWKNSANKLCKFDLDFKVAWKDLSNEELFNIDPIEICRRPLQVVQHMCSKEVYDEELGAEVSTIICAFGDINKIEILDEKLVWQANVRNPFGINEFYKFIQERYSEKEAASGN